MRTSFPPAQPNLPPRAAAPGAPSTFTVLLAALAAFPGIAPAAADMPPLSGETLRQSVSGATVHLDTPLGTRLPLSFGADGRVTGTAGPILAAYLGSATDRGRWWVEKDKLCSKWLKWFDTDTNCMRIWRDGDKVRWYGDDGKSGTATIVTDTDPARSALGGPLPPEASPTPAAVAATPPVQPAAPPSVTTPQGSAPPNAAAAAISGKHAQKKGPAVPARQTVAGTVVPLRPLIPPQAQPAAKPVAVATAEPAPAASVTPPIAPVAPAVPVPAAAEPMPAPIAAAPRYEAAPLPANPATSFRAPPPPMVYRVVNVTSFDVLNVRRGPSQTAELAGEIPPNGRGIRMSGACVGAWCQIRYGRVSGWVNRFYLVADSVSISQR